MPKLRLLGDDTGIHRVVDNSANLPFMPLLRSILGRTHRPERSCVGNSVLSSLLVD